MLLLAPSRAQDAVIGLSAHQRLRDVGLPIWPLGLSVFLLRASKHGKASVWTCVMWLGGGPSPSVSLSPSPQHSSKRQSLSQSDWRYSLCSHSCKNVGV